jgi:hypothetical protein
MTAVSAFDSGFRSPILRHIPVKPILGLYFFLVFGCTVFFILLLKCLDHLIRSLVACRSVVVTQQS